MKTYSFTCYKGREITTDSGYKTLSGAIRAVDEWVSLGWYIDYIFDSDDICVKVMDHKAMGKASANT